MKLLPRTVSWVLGQHRPAAMFVVMGALVLFNVYAFTQSPVTAVKTAVCVAPTLLVLGCGLWVPASKTDNPVRGVPVHEHEQPELWALVRGIAGGTGTAPPDANHLVADANAAVMEDTRPLGLISTRRHLFIGAPPVAETSSAELAATTPSALHRQTTVDRSHTPYRPTVTFNRRSLDLGRLTTQRHGNARASPRTPACAGAPLVGRTTGTLGERAGLPCPSYGLKPAMAGGFYSTAAFPLRNWVASAWNNGGQVRSIGLCCRAAGLRPGVPQRVPRRLIRACRVNGVRTMKALRETRRSAGSASAGGAGRELGVVLRRIGAAASGGLCGT